eukprot:399634-Prymnesium_polylepis.1
MCAQRALEAGALHRPQSSRPGAHLLDFTDGGVAHLYALSQRARTLDRTVYSGPRPRAGSACFTPHYALRRAPLRRSGHRS